MAHDVLPCARIGKGQLVGCDANDRAIAFVPFQDVKGLSPRQERVTVRYAAAAREPWSWKGTERVKVDIVEQAGNIVADELGSKSVFHDRRMVFC